MKLNSTLLPICALIAPTDFDKVSLPLKTGPPSLED